MDVETGKDDISYEDANLIVWKDVFYMSKMTSEYLH